jgi:pSer/pThr/pTyr-binding forkhead associated (FHA) protein
MRRSAVLIVLMMALALTVASKVFAAEYPINYVLQNGKTLANTVVTVRGAVANSQAVTPGPLSKIKGEYDLTDEGGASIHVRTTSDPPANGVARTVKATVEASEAVPVLMEIGGPLGGMNPMLIAALAVLVILAIVLVILMLRKPARAPAVAGGAPVSAAAPPIVSPTAAVASKTSANAGKICPKCQAKNDADANFCESCREPLRSSGTVKPTVAPTGQSAGQSQKATVQISATPEESPLADLTVVEGDGAKYGTKFTLRKTRQKLGRLENMEIRLNDETISREHASIWWQDGQFYIQDEASTGGTLLNGQKVTRQSLSDNDTIQLGKTKLVFRVIPGKS